VGHPLRDMAEASSGMPNTEVIHLGLSDLAPGTSYGPASEPCWEFVWMVDGTATAVVNEETVTIGESSAMLVHPGDRVTYHWGPGPNVRQGFVMFATDAPIDAEGSRRILIGSPSVVRPLLEHVIWLETERPTGWWGSVALAFQYTLRALTHGDSTAEPDDGSLPRPIIQSLHFVADEWAKGPILPTFSLAQLAAAAGVTPEHLCRLYANFLGIGPVATVRLLRLKRAAALLNQTNMSVVEIARTTGFSSEFHFSRTFKSAAGASPSMFRGDRTRAFELPTAVRRLQRYLQ
jgi:AraC family transcriptional regulator